MIFKQADRERIAELTTAVTSLRLDVGQRSNAVIGPTPRGNSLVEGHPYSLHVRLNDAFALLNELGAALGRIESAIKPLSKLGLETGARQTDRKVLDEMLSGYNSDRILEFEGIKKGMENIGIWFRQLDRSVVDTVNRRADEALDVVRGLSARVDNLHNSPLTPLGEALASLPVRSDMVDEAIVALSARVSELTGLVQAEVSEASTFRKELRRKVDWQFPSMEQMRKSNRKMIWEMLNRDTKPKRKARRKKK